MIDLYTDDFFMSEALKEAQKAFEKNEVPIGAVVVANKKIIARAHNMTESLSDSTAHAEMLAITAAENFLGSKYLRDCVLYVTLEPCVMCAGACFWSKIGKIVYAADDLRYGYKKSQDKLFHPKTVVISNVLKDKASNLINLFFESKRI